MGFRKDAFAKVWDIKPVSDAQTQLRISRTDRQKNTRKTSRGLSNASVLRLLRRLRIFKRVRVSGLEMLILVLGITRTQKKHGIALSAFRLS